MKQYEIEKLIDKVGGSFKLTILIQRRLLELKKGAPPLVESTSSNLMDIIYEEILTDKIWLEEPEEQELASEEEKLPTTYFSFSSQNYDEDQTISFYICKPSPLCDFVLHTITMSCHISSSRYARYISKQR